MSYSVSSTPVYFRFYAITLLIDLSNKWFTFINESQFHKKIIYFK